MAPPPARSRPSSASSSTLQLTPQDLRLLEFIADHRVVLAAHLQMLLERSLHRTQRRLRQLREAGYLEQRTVFQHQPSCYLISKPGLAAIGSALPRPRVHLPGYLHDVGAAWLWLAASGGQFGPVREVISERQLRSRDGLPREAGYAFGLDRPRTSFGVRLWESGPRGHERLHYPDLVLERPDGRRVALELELSSKGNRRLEKIISAYASDRRIDAVVYLVERPAVARAVRRAAAAAGVSELVHVQPFAWAPSLQPLVRHLAPTRSRSTPQRTTAVAR